ncbi:beta-lactamase family protein [Fusarium austroafricanum]|uniref:Beta-lactamase family protein n=1 Tax=Fusarium austroafricanum TaxID=2364996 RepID=A0A8H4KJ01_9HYPO|nr:beta-lactamase family protein [Fusarium austroafricanum]
MGAFSLHDPNAASELQYHYTSPEIQNNTVGVTKVDEDSIYRFASVSKLVTAYAGMVSLTEEEWNRPFTKIFSELEKSDDLTRVPQWQYVTPLSLASYISGVIGNAPPFPVADMALDVLNAALPDPVTLGLPPRPEPNPSLSKECEGQNSSCTIEDIIKEASSRYPTYQPWTAPTYSNHGFILLGLALEKLTNQTLQDVYNNALFKPLKMSSSDATDPKHLVDRVVVPGGDIAGVFVDSGLGAASGGVYSTLNDMNKFGLSILNHTLLSEQATKQWMKPVSHTTSLNFSVGVGWEILRYTHPVTNAVTDLYTKLGDSGPNGGGVVVIPDYGVGFNCLVASTDELKSTSQRFVLDAVIRHWLPALEAQAGIEAKANFAGTYAPKDKKLNSSLALTYEPSIGGLWVSDWISNSTDVLANQPAIFKSNYGLRLLPSIYDKEHSKYAFRIRSGFNQTIADANNLYGPFTGTGSDDWISTGQFGYGGIPLDLAVFGLDDEGKAVSVELPAFNVTLKREG